MQLQGNGTLESGSARKTRGLFLRISEAGVRHSPYVSCLEMEGTDGSGLTTELKSS